jgi:predicted dehydrogenase
MMSDIDITLSIVKSGIRKISATGISVFSKENDIVNVKLEFDNGCVANLSASRLSKVYRNETQFFQKEKCVTVNFLTNELEEVDLKNTTDSKLIVSTLPEIEALNPIKYEFKSFYDVIVNDKEPIVSLEDGYNSLIVAHKILDILNHSNVPAVDNNY